MASLINSLIECGSFYLTDHIQFHINETEELTERKTKKEDDKKKKEGDKKKREKKEIKIRKDNEKKKKEKKKKDKRIDKKIRIKMSFC